MAWHRFSGDFDWRSAEGLWTIAYKAGMACNLTAAAARAAVAAGLAAPMKRPSRALAQALSADPYHPRSTPHGP